MIVSVLVILLICSMLVFILPAQVTAEANPNSFANAKVLFTFDDGWEDQYIYAYPILRNAGFSATAYLNRNAVENHWDEMMSLAQAQELHDNGWDIGNHTTNHHEIGDQTDPESLAELRTMYLENQNWIISEFGERGAYHACYPSGLFSDPLIDVLKNIGVLTARATIESLISTPISNPDDYYRLPVKPITSNWGDMTSTLAKIDKAVTNGQTLIFFLHRVDLERAELTTITSDFQEVVDYCKYYSDQGLLSVMTMSEWYNNETGYDPPPAGSFRVSFNSMGGLYVDPVIAAENTTITAPDNPVKTGYDFAGWFKEAACDSEWDFATDTVTSNLTLFAKWTPKSCTVTFKDYDGTTLKTQIVNYGGAATAPADPDNKPHYHFTGWDVAFTNITANTTVTALYSINSYTVTFKDYDGTTLKTQIVNYGGAAAAPANPNNKPHYHFTGWDVAFTNITANKTVTALYSIDQFTVTFKDYDGTTLKTQIVNYGGAATAPANPDNKPHYHFTSWDVAFTNITANTTVTALYSINSYTVTFKDYDGTTLKTQSVNYGGAATAPADPDNKPHYHFTGWDVAFNNITGQYDGHGPLFDPSIHRNLQGL